MLRAHGQAQGLRRILGGILVVASIVTLVGCDSDTPPGPKLDVLPGFDVPSFDGAKLDLGACVALGDPCANDGLPCCEGVCANVGGNAPVCVIGADAGVDAITDQGPTIDSTVDGASTDTTVDSASTDSTVDTTSTDSTVDTTSTDSTVDTTSDTTVDATVDTTVDGTVDVGVDATADSSGMADAGCLTLGANCDPSNNLCCSGFCASAGVGAPICAQPLSDAAVADAPRDAGVDSTADASLDSTADASLDSTEDTTADATADSSVDTVSPDQSVDTLSPDQSVDTLSPDQSVDTLSPDQSVDTLSPDQSVDTLSPDSSFDTVSPPDTTVDLPVIVPDTTFDTLAPDQTVDVLPDDSTVDTVPDDSTVDTVPDDSTVDSTVDTVPDDSTVDSTADSTVDTVPDDSTVDTVTPCVPGDTECTDCIDNDGDGQIDSDDEECTGPLDRSEATFSNAIPGDNIDCTEDCFFDGDSGAGNDGCSWDIKCDPLAPRRPPPQAKSCEYTYSGTGNPVTDPACVSVPQTCLDVCLPITPNGCDCFGCCTVPFGAPGETINIKLMATCDISKLADTEACRRCTQVPACLNTCEECELCIGKPTVPASCSSWTCPRGLTKCGDGWETEPDIVDPTTCGLYAANGYCLDGCCVGYDG